MTADFKKRRLKKRMLKMLEIVSKHYNLNNRASVDNACVYVFKAEDGEVRNCAVGMFLPKRIKSIIEDNVDINSAGVQNLFKFLKKKKIATPKRLKGLSITFLNDLQNLHDTNKYWEVNGMSFIGKREVKHIRLKILDNYYLHGLNVD